MAEDESELVYISQFEFATIVDSLKILTQFKHKSKSPGKDVVNKFETVITEVVGSKYDNVFLDFKNCSASERNKIRSAYTRIETKMRKNVQNKKKMSHDLPSDKAFISSEEYKTLIFFTSRQSVDERYIHI